MGLLAHAASGSARFASRIHPLLPAPGQVSAYRAATDTAAVEILRTLVKALPSLKELELDGPGW